MKPLIERKPRLLVWELLGSIRDLSGLDPETLSVEWV